MLTIPTIFEPRLRAAALRAAPGPPGTQARRQLLAQLTFGLHEDRLVDRLVRHPPLWLVGMIPTQPLSDLLGRPPLGAQQRLHLDPQPRPVSRSTRLRAVAPPRRPDPGPRYARYPARPPSSGDLPPDRARDADPAGRRSPRRSHHARSRHGSLRVRRASTNRDAAVRVRNTTTASSLIRRRNVDTEIPANAAASATRHPPRHRHQRRRHHRPRHPRSTHPTPPHTRSCRAHHLRPPSISRTRVTRSTLLRRHALDPGGLGPRFETAAAPIPSTARTRRPGPPAPASEPADVTSPRPDPIQDPRMRPGQPEIEKEE